MSTKNYFIGIDAGTSNTGWAVTDTQYKVMKFNGKKMWGVRLFEEAQTAIDRRVYRSQRRRYKRKQQRIDLLNLLFASEISAIDFTFFKRLDESFFNADDKEVDGKYSLFYDKNFTDKDYFKLYPTIYHLRQELIYSKEPHDIRLVYLACLHILKNRGHFLYENDLQVNNFDISESFIKLNNYMQEYYDMNFDLSRLSEINEIIENSNISNRDKKLKMYDILSANNKILKKMTDSIFGSKIKVKDLFEENYSDSDISFSFASANFEENINELMTELGDDYIIIDSLYEIYNWIILQKLLKGNKYLSDAMVGLYDKHKKDLKLLKDVIKTYLPNDYNTIFRDNTEKSNYVAYIKKTKNNNTKTKVKKCEREDFYKYIKKTLSGIKPYESDDRIEIILKDIENETFMPKQVSKNNNTIPYQINKNELEIILNNASCYLQFLNEKDEDGLTVKYKILSIISYRIPYYVGPINGYHSKDTGGFAWIEKLSEGKVYPWNFDKIVDKEKCAEKFINSLINKCTYLYKCYVIPKKSLLYSEYTVLSELNQIKFNGEKIDNNLKLKIYNELFKTEKSVTDKKLRNFLLNNNIYTADEIKELTITGYQKEKGFASNLSSYITMKNLFGDVVDTNPKMIEDIIEWCTIYTDKKMLINKIKTVYNLPNEKLQQIKGLSFEGWSSLSREFLTEIVATNSETGEMINIMDSLRTSNKVLNEILYDKEFNFYDLINEQNSFENKISGKISYNEINELYCSPTVKRQLWQSVKIIDEIIEIKGYIPDKIFIEVTRKPGKKERTKSRKHQLEYILKDLKTDESKELLKMLTDMDESKLRDDRLFLYFTQQGKCMYTGQPIDLNDLFSQSYDIDHIYPRSLTKDDSVLNNIVLVCKKVNADKKDIYPLNSSIQSKMFNYWRYLHSNKLITDEKYNRLCRQTELTDKELAGFIERQLVETNQTVKELARILKEHYPETKIVYSKANNVTEFRKDFELTKVREINDFHHAKDAYLNIVVGNIFDVKYGNDFRKYYASKSNQKNRDYFNLNDIYKSNVQNNDYMAWNVNNTLNKVKKQYYANDILTTKMPIINKGKFYDENAISAKKGLTPLKKGRLSNTAKYGGYNSVKPAYFFAVEYADKNKRKIKIDTIPVLKLKQIRGNNDALIKYCIENLNLENPKIIIPEIKKYSLIQYNGNNLYIAGNEETQILYHNAKQLIISKDYILDIKKICRFIDKSKGKDNIKVTSSDDITAEKNQKIFNMLIDRIGKEYGDVLASTYKKLDYNREAFSNYCIEDQCQIIYNMLALTRCNAEMSDLSIYDNGFTKNLISSEGKIRKVKNITKSYYAGSWK